MNTIGAGGRRKFKRAFPAAEHRRIVADTVSQGNHAFLGILYNIFVRYVDICAPGGGAVRTGGSGNGRGATLVRRGYGGDFLRIYLHARGECYIFFPGTGLSCRRCGIKQFFKSVVFPIFRRQGICGELN